MLARVALAAPAAAKWLQAHLPGGRPHEGLACLLLSLSGTFDVCVLDVGVLCLCSRKLETEGSTWVAPPHL
jgi:hypothetical protein